MRHCVCIVGTWLCTQGNLVLGTWNKRLGITVPGTRGNAGTFEVKSGNLWEISGTLREIFGTLEEIFDTLWEISGKLLQLILWEPGSCF